jgi:DNA-binding Lrp family transcriptional regulator
MAANALLVYGWSSSCGRLVMANKAYVLIETAIGKSTEVRGALHKFDWVRSVDRVSGAYDVIAVAQGETSGDIVDVVNDRIGHIDGIIRAVVCPAP